jgi:hypothetical protein
MTAREILEVMRNAGFPVETAIIMTAIALRESAGNPDAFNGNDKTGDRSYGLLQINMFGSLAEPRMKLFGLTDEKQLFDPAVNAHAGFKIWGGNDKNLDVAWYINRPGIYRDRYLGHLPEAQRASGPSLSA